MKSLTNKIYEGFFKNVGATPKDYDWAPTDINELIDMFRHFIGDDIIKPIKVYRSSVTWKKSAFSNDRYVVTGPHFIIHLKDKSHIKAYMKWGGEWCFQMTNDGGYVGPRLGDDGIFASGYELGTNFREWMIKQIELSSRSWSYDIFLKKIRCKIK